MTTPALLLILCASARPSPAAICPWPSSAPPIKSMTPSMTTTTRAKPLCTATPTAATP
ncbi:hypothetical protein EVA_13697 [gut metagenome]|uniref:Uncharacterized protein n=1 Tax=gut metagenome TaxID=749906 RepID=J9G8V4_9ZZZZ